MVRLLRRYILPLSASVILATLYLEKEALSSWSSAQLIAQQTDLPTNVLLFQRNDQSGDSHGTVDTTATNITAANSISNDPCAGREWAIDIIRASPVTPVTDDLCRQLPTRATVASLYGSEPIVYGLETCEQFRQNVRQVQQEEKGATRRRARKSVRNGPAVRVAGLYNTGTNALAIMLGRNLEQRLHSTKGNGGRGTHRSADFLKEALTVPWTKHLPARMRDKTRQRRDADLDLRLVLPVVLVRDPYWWFQSMCKASYDATWDKKNDKLGRRCPNMVRKTPADGKEAFHQVTVNYERKFRLSYPSLVHWWNRWNREYLTADFPRLMVRFEDQLFHSEKVLQIIGECAGVPVRQPFRYFLAKAKSHGKPQSFVSALTKYSSPRGRRSAIDAVDLELAERALDPELMDLFGYRHRLSSEDDDEE